MSGSRWVRRGVAVGALVAVAVISSVSTTMALGSTFADVPPSHPFSDEIEFMAASGIADGFPDGSYRPNAPVTRQAMAAFMLRAQTYTYADETVAAETPVSATAQCPTGTIAVGGGVTSSSPSAFVSTSNVTDERDGWTAQVSAPGGPVDITITVTATCVPGSPVNG